MATIIIYLEDETYINRTVNDLLDKTAPSLVEQIIICDDNNIGFKHDKVEILTTDRVGRSIAWDNASHKATSDQIVFLCDTVKFSNGWLEPLIDSLKKDKDLIVTPTIYDLDVDLWSSGSDYIKHFGWRWDLRLYNRQSDSLYSPSVSSNCFVVNKQWLVELGGFDRNMNLGDGESLELSVRNWLFGGSIKTIPNSSISVLTKENENVSNLARIIEVWFPAFASYFYNIRNIKPSDLEIGRLDNLTDLQNRQQTTADGFLSCQMPELLGIYKLMNSAAGKSIAVVSDGPSIDFINPALIYKHDIIIAVDYIGNLFDCDYVMTNSADVVTHLRERHSDTKLVLPTLLESKAWGHMINSNEVSPSSLKFEVSGLNYINSSLYPPFINFGHIVHNAIHFALFLGPSTITLFGCDNKIINGKSHSSKVKHYNDGMLWTDSEATRRRFASFEYGLSVLGDLAVKSGIMLFRTNHV